MTSSIESVSIKHSEDLKALQQRFMRLQLKLSRLSGQSVELTRQKVALTKSISLAKARVEMAPEVSSVFEYMQEKAHARAVGEFEELLSAFVQDVVPQSGEIRLELGTERGSPSLDVFVDNGGDLESILDGNGGGLTNVVVTGLTFSALSRTQNRQFIVLDEPDCWLKSSYVPAFTKVIAQVANPQVFADGTTSSGVQTLMISHNDVSLMDESAHIKELRLETDIETYASRAGLDVVFEGEPSPCAYATWQPGGGKNGSIKVTFRDDAYTDDENNALTKGFPVVDSLSGAKPFEPSHPGVRWIQVRNLRHHVFTHLELSDGLNVLAGDINSGKSTLYLTAMRALAYGETDDTMIRHGAESAIIRIGLEDGIELEVERRRRGSPKVLFRRYEKGKLIHEGRPESRNSVPGFIEYALKIVRVDDLDIQLRSQKQPVFLLNEPASRRARLLSVGKESGLLQILIERHRLALRRDRELLKKEEAELAHKNRLLRALAPLGSLEGLVPLMDAMISEALNLEDDSNKLATSLSELGPLTKKKVLVSIVEPSLGSTPIAPEVFDAESLKRRLGELSVLSKVSRLSVPDCVKVPEVFNSKALEDRLIKLESLSKISLVSVPEDALEAPSQEAFKQASLMESSVGSLTALGDIVKLRLVGPIPDVPKIDDTASIISSGVGLRQGVKELQRLTIEQKEAQASLIKAKEELIKLKEQIGICPTCEKPFKEHENV